MAESANALLQPTSATHTATVVLSGQWRLGVKASVGVSVVDGLTQGGFTRVQFESQQLSGWDSSLLTFLVRLIDTCEQHQITLDRDGLPGGVQKLLSLSEAVPETENQQGDKDCGVFCLIGSETVELVGGFQQMLAFIGEACIALVRLLMGRARFHGSELLRLMAECGAQALPIVSLIAFLVGIILAFMSAVQLELFGATIYVANLVGLGMARDMGAMMAAIIMAGRTGAAYAAQIGTMQVNEEVDALRTLGISPMEFLVLPRLLALTLMMPLLCVYADFMGILGGAVATSSVTEVTFQQYFSQTQVGVPIKHFVAGLIKSGVYGLLVAIAGCLRGIQCGRSAQAVGEATTSAVVSSIIWIVIACALLTVLYFMVGL